MTYLKPHLNPHDPLTDEWMSWKEQNEGNDYGTGPYVPYHIGKTPSGDDCPTMPRVMIVRPGVYRCPACGTEFQTTTARLAEIARLATVARTRTRCVMDFPTAFAFIDEHHPDPASHDPKCSYATHRMLRDCHLLNDEYARRKALLDSEEGEIQ